MILAHSYTAMIDGTGKVFKAEEYPLATSSPRAPERFRSTLFDDGGDDDGGIMRTEVLRRIGKKDSYHHADRTIISELALQGPFYQVPDWLYFRRDHPERAERANPSMRSRCANMDPRRADKLRHPAVRLYGEYVWAYVRMIRQAPLSAAEKRECYRYLGEWAASRARSPAPRAGAAGRRRARQHQRRRARGRPEGEHALTRRSTSARGERRRAQSRPVRPARLGQRRQRRVDGGHPRLPAVPPPGAVVDAMCMGPEQLTARYGLPAIPLQWAKQFEGRLGGGPPPRPGRWARSWTRAGRSAGSASTTR